MYSRHYVIKDPITLIRSQFHYRILYKHNERKECYYVHKHNKDSCLQDNQDNAPRIGNTLYLILQDQVLLE